MALLLSSVTAFLLLKVTNMKDFGMAFYGTVTDLNILIDFVITIWKMPTIFKFIKLSEKFMEQSKLHSNGYTQKQTINYPAISSGKQRAYLFG